MDKLFYSVTETAHVVGICKTSVYNLINAGLLKAVKVGGRRLIPVEAVKALADVEAKQMLTGGR